MRRSLVAIVLIFSAVFSYAQNFSNKGKDFWVAYGFHVRMAQSAGGSTINSQNMVLYFATDEVTNITISIPSLGYTQTITSPASPTVLTSAAIPKGISQDARLTVESTSPEDKGIHIVADKPVVAYAHIYDGAASGTTILFPVTTLGKEYYSINYTARSNENNSNAWFYVIATDTGTTTVEITPSANTINHPANIPFTINMTQGQVFNVMGQLTGFGGGGGGFYSGVDLTGSKIKSIGSGNGACKRIAVFSGAGKMFISCDGTSSSSDNYMAQAFPKDAWGKKFLTVPTSSLVNNFFRVCVSNPASIVRVNGAPISTSPLINNFYYNLPLTSVPQKIECDDPITVAQYIASQGECGNPTPTGTYPGDPEVIYLSPVEQNITRILWNASPFNSITQHYYNVVIPNSGTAISSFKLDGVNVSPTSFTVHPQDPNFSYLSSRLSASGVHSIESDSGFNAIAYGYGAAESYGFNAGTNIKNLYSFISPENSNNITNQPVAITGYPVYLTVTFPFEPTYLNWNFNANPNQSPNSNLVINNPVADTTYLIDNKRVWRYRIPFQYTFTQANSSPGYLISISAGTQSFEGCENSIENEFFLAVYDSSDIVLPLDKIELTGANINNKTNKLLFKVYNPSFIKQYEIQRSTTGNNFSTISVIALNTNNQHQTDFDYVDQSLITNSNFYRIKVVNIDGSVQYSNLIKIASKIKDFDITMPTSVISNNQVSLLIQSKNKGNAQFFVVDVIGRVMQSDKFVYQKGTQQNTINLNANLPKGIYFLKLIAENIPTPFVFKMIK